MLGGKRVVFDHVNLERGEFYSAHLATACFFDCDLSGADVSQVNLPGLAATGRSSQKSRAANIFGTS
jgi:uncharacterized protein YjbI with pentapeptide repeats